MAAPMPYLEKTAINPVAPITIARSASFSVYDLNDTTFTTPLNVTRLSDGVTTTTLLSDSNGYLPDFTVIDRNSVVLRTADGTFKKTIVTSSPVQGPPGSKGDKGDPGPAGASNVALDTDGVPYFSPGVSQVAIFADTDGVPAFVGA